MTSPDIARLADETTCIFAEALECSEECKPQTCSCKSYAERVLALRSASLPAGDVRGEVESAPVAWQWRSAGAWHTVDNTEVSNPEVYARSLSSIVRPVYTSPTASAEADMRLDVRQKVVVEWGRAAFGADHMADKIVRAARFFEEAAELVQAVGLPQDHAQRAFDHVYSREVGDPAQEAGGVANTLMALCDAIGLSLDQCQQKEIARCLAKDPAHFAARNLEKLRDVDALPFSKGGKNSAPAKPRMTDRQISNIVHGRDKDDNGEFTASSMGAEQEALKAKAVELASAGAGTELPPGLGGHWYANPSNETGTKSDGDVEGHVEQGQGTPVGSNVKPFDSATCNNEVGIKPGPSDTRDKALEEAAIPLDDLALYWRGRAQTLSLLQAHATQPGERTSGLIDAYRECATELKRALASRPAARESQPVLAWAAWHPVKGFAQLANACADLDDAIKDAKVQSIMDGSPEWIAVRVEIRKSPAAPDDGWLPIESAPKDGTAVLVKLPGSDCPLVARLKGKIWRVAWDGYGLIGIDLPTHWRSLTLPQATQELR